MKIESPIGLLTLVRSDIGLRAVLWANDPAGRVKFESSLVEDVVDPLLLEASSQLREYFAGSRQEFSLPLDLRGTEFQKRSWIELTRIPFGQTITYKTQAENLGDAKKARAVGAANGRNPLSIIIPCHRVVGHAGSLTGFAGGLSAKAFLLELERNACR